MTFIEDVIDTLQTLAHHGETIDKNIEFHPKQLREILSALVTQKRRILDLEDEMRSQTITLDELRQTDLYKNVRKKLTSE